MSNHQAPFEVNPYRLAMSAANDSNLTSPSTESLPSNFPSYAASPSPSVASSIVHRSEGVAGDGSNFSKDSSPRLPSSGSDEIDSAVPNSSGSSPFGSLPPVAAIGYVTSTAAASTIHSSTGASWTVEEETFFFATLDENKAQRRGGTYNWTSVLERMKTFWIANKGPSFERSQSALKSRLDRRKNLEEVGLTHLTYNPRPWTPEEEAKLLNMKADHQAMNGYIGVDYSLAVHLFVGRPRFELREKRAALVAEEKRKAKQEEDQKRRNAEIEQYKAQVQASALAQTQQSSSLQAFQSHGDQVHQSASPQTSSYSHASNTPSTNSANPHAPFPTRPIAALPQPNQSSSYRPLNASPQASASLISLDLLSESSNSPTSPFTFIPGRSVYSGPPSSRPVKRPEPFDSPDKNNYGVLLHASKRIRSEVDEANSGFKEKEETSLVVGIEDTDVFDEGVELIKKMRKQWQELDEEWERLKEGKGGDKEMEK